MPLSGHTCLELFELVLLRLFPQKISWWLSLLNIHSQLKWHLITLYPVIHPRFLTQVTLYSTIQFSSQVIPLCNRFVKNLIHCVSSYIRDPISLATCNSLPLNCPWHYAWHTVSTQISEEWIHIKIIMVNIQSVNIY